MPMNTSYITCSECSTVNLNRDYCSNCGNLLDVVRKRQLEDEKKIHDKMVLQEKSKKEPNKIELFLENGGEHSNILVRFFFKVSYYIWIFFAFVIGGIISMIVAIAAG